MHMQMNEEGGLDILNLSTEQVELLAKALKDSPQQDFMQNEELNRMFKVIAIIQSELFSDMKAGRFDFNQFKKQ